MQSSEDLVQKFQQDLIDGYTRQLEEELLYGRKPVANNPIPPAPSGYFRQRLWPMSILGPVPCRSICDPWTVTRYEPKAQGGIVPPLYIDEMLRSLGQGRLTTRPPGSAARAPS